MEATISVPEDFEERESCYVVNFANGNLLPSAKRKPTFTLYNKKNDRTKKKRIVVAETDHLSYVGTNYDSESAASGSRDCRYLVGALDEDTGIMTLHKAEVITMRPHIPGTDVEEPVDTEGTPVKVDTRKSIDQMVSLFGSEKQKRAFSAAKRNKVEADVLESALVTAVSHAQTEVDKDSTDSVSMQSSGLMPPHNPLAEAPQDVYNLNDIISLSEIKVLKKTGKFLSKATVADISQWRQEGRYPNYILQHVHQLPSVEPHKSLKAAILLYASFLIKMHNMSSKTVEREGLQFEGVAPPAEVKTQLLHKFTEKLERVGKGGKTVHSLSNRMKDKIRLHLLVLSLIIDDFSVECQTLQRDLKLTSTKIQDYYRALGCTMMKSAIKREAPKDEAADAFQPTANYTAILKIPLNFPKPKKSKKARN